MAGGKSTSYAASILKLCFQAVSIANLADAPGTSGITSIFVALHSADPGVGGNQSTNEVSYGGYARQGVVRSSAGWTITGDSISPANPITFPTCTSGTVTATYFSCGYTVASATVIFYSGPISPNISISTGVTPQLTTLSAITEA